MCVIRICLCHKLVVHHHPHPKPYPVMHLPDCAQPVGGGLEGLFGATVGFPSWEGPAISVGGVVVVPELSTWAMFSIGMAVLAWAAVRKGHPKEVRVNV